MKHKNLFSFILFLCLMSLSFAIRAQDYMVDPSFNPTFGGRTHQFWDFLNAVAVQPDQKILVGGNFTNVNGNDIKLIVRLNPNGTRDTTFNPPLGAGANDQVETIKLLPDGKMYVAGTFHIGTTVTYLVRLNADGSLDSSFVTPLAGVVKSIDLYPDGRFMACGAIGSPFDPTWSKLARFNQDGSRDTSFQANIAGNTCYDVKLLPDGSMYAAGTITGVNGIGIPGLVKLSATGVRDASFNVYTESYPFISREHYRLALQPDGKLLAATKGWYTNSQGDLLASLGVRRYQTDGTYQVIGNCGWSESSTTFFLQDDGKLITNGCAVQPGSQFYNFARFLPDGSFDTALNRLNFDNPINSIARQADGSYVITGSFNNVEGQPRPRIVRLTTSVPAVRHRFDFDGDGKDDLAVFRPGDRYWYLSRSTSGPAYVQWGLSTDKAVAADYDDDGKTDVAVFRDGQWYILRSSDGALLVQSFGQAGDKPLVGDLNGDGKVDMIVRRPLPNNSIEWQIRYFGSTGVSATQTLSGEAVSDPSMVGDFDGDNTDELAYFRDGNWYSRKVGAASPLRTFLWGQAGDMPAPGDYDRDGQTDYAVFRPSTGDWYINRSTAGFLALHFGANGDIPVPADYDGDGKADLAVFRNGAWYQFLSSTGTFRANAWGLSGDLPIPAQTN
ncbi:MAG: VCBS repeat-containing protein [Acidobacteria bacterium]|nr:VCBS repeat-containing protein [Acidobacteriota bacterium]